MMRAFNWEDVTETCAILHGPEEGMIAAVIQFYLGTTEESYGFWWICSGEYSTLNFKENDISIPFEQMKRAVLVRLGNEINESVNRLNQDKENILSLLYQGEEEDPYA